MTFLSAVMGSLLPQFIYKEYVETLTGLLFIGFGLSLLRDALRMKGGIAEIQKEIQHVSEELQEANYEFNGQEHDKCNAFNTENDLMQQLLFISRIGKNLLKTTFSPIWIQAFVLTFAAEWGDRSQIAIIALAGTEVKTL